MLPTMCHCLFVGANHQLPEITVDWQLEVIRGPLPKPDTLTLYVQEARPEETARHCFDTAFVYEVGAWPMGTGLGDDNVIPGLGDDFVSAGAGDDYIFGCPETDFAEGKRDLYIGGEGFDTLDMSQRKSRVVAEGPTPANTSFDQFSRRGFDRPFGREHPRRLGDDVEEPLQQGRRWRRHADRRVANDTIVGGAGRDVMKGLGGNDTINANDGLKEAIVEVVWQRRQGRDRPPGSNPKHQGHCESIDRRPNKAERGTIIASRRARLRGRRVRIKLTCPRRGKRGHRRPRRRVGCAGRLRLKLAENGARRPRAKRYRIRRGKSRRITVRLNRREARRGAAPAAVCSRL